MIKKSKIIRSLCTVLVCMVLVQACKKDQAPPPAPAPSKPANAASSQAKPILKAVSSSSPLVQAPSSNQFDFSNKKDPFKPFIIAKPASGSSNETAKKVLRDALPIHSFDVSKFKLIGIITGGKENKAMVTDPNGKGYVLKVGMTIGNSNGKITSITSSGVDVLEQFTDDNGRVRKENIKITLPRKQ